MKQIGIVLLLVVLLAACSQQALPNAAIEEQATTDWKLLGGDLRSSLREEPFELSPVIALLNDQPVVAWQDREFSDIDPNVALGISVKQWNGTAWKEIGKPSDFQYATGSSFSPSLAAQKNGKTLGIAWSTTFANIFVKLWDGKKWQQVGDTVAFGQDPQLAFDSANRPVVAYTAFPGDVYVNRWDGANWVQLGGPINNISNSGSSPSLTIDALGRPVVAWEEYEGDFGYNTYVKRWNGTSWNLLGKTLNINTNNSTPTHPSIGLLFNLLPVVSWTENSNIYAKAWLGWNWTSLGGRLNTVLGVAGGQTLAVGPRNQPVVAFNDLIQPDAKRWMCSQFGCSWSSLGSTSMSVTDIVINSKDQPIVVGLTADAFGAKPKINVRQYSK